MIRRNALLITNGAIKLRTPLATTRCLLWEDASSYSYSSRLIVSRLEQADGRSWWQEMALALPRSPLKWSKFQSNKVTKLLPPVIHCSFSVELVELALILVRAICPSWRIVPSMRAARTLDWAASRSGNFRRILARLLRERKQVSWQLEFSVCVFLESRCAACSLARLN